MELNLNSSRKADKDAPKRAAHDLFRVGFYNRLCQNCRTPLSSPSPRPFSSHSRALILAKDQPRSPRKSEELGSIDKARVESKDLRLGEKEKEKDPIELEPKATEKGRLIRKSKEYKGEEVLGDNAREEEAFKAKEREKERLKEEERRLAEKRSRIAKGDWEGHWLDFVEVTSKSQQLASAFASPLNAPPSLAPLCLLCASKPFQGEVLDEFLRADKELEELRKLKKELSRESGEEQEEKVVESIDLLDELELLLNQRDSDSECLKALASEEKSLFEELEGLEGQRAQLYFRETEVEDEMARLIAESEALEESLVDVKKFGGLSEIFKIDLDKTAPRIGKISGLRLNLRNTEESWAELSSALGQCALLMKSLISWQTIMKGSDSWRGPTLKVVTLLPVGSKSYLMKASDPKPWPLFYQPFTTSQVTSWMKLPSFISENPFDTALSLLLASVSELWDFARRDSPFAFRPLNQEQIRIKVDEGKIGEMSPEVKFYSIKYHDSKNARDEWNNALYLLLEVLKQLVEWLEITWKPK